MKREVIFSLLLGLVPSLTSAGNTEIVSAQAEQSSKGHYHIRVTLRHDDTGWDHYANAWRVLAPDGTILGERILFHPHVNEQPFTRSLSGVTIPDDINYIEIEAQDSKHGISQGRFRISLQR